MSPCHPLTVLPCHPVTPSPCHPVTGSSVTLLAVTGADPSAVHADGRLGQHFVNFFFQIQAREGGIQARGQNSFKRRQLPSLAEPGGTRLEGYCVKCRAK